MPNCGDGNLECGEQCDDGNTDDCDGCSAACTNEPNPVCGDGNLDPCGGETCDDGNTIDCDGCDASCVIEPVPNCGDSNLDCGEQCDDGNTNSGDGCNDVCQLEGACCDGAGGCTDLSLNDCNALGGMHAGDGTSCSDVPDPCEIPACDPALIDVITLLKAIESTPRRSRRGHDLDRRCQRRRWLRRLVSRQQQGAHPCLRTDLQPCG